MSSQSPMRSGPPGLGSRVGALLARAFRVARRAIAFSYFGLGGLVLGFAVLPLQRRFAASPEAADLRAQWLIHQVSRSFIRLIEILRLAEVHWDGTGVLREGPLLIVANHPSLIDTPLLACCLPQADFVVSAGWSFNPFLGRAAKGAGYLPSALGAGLVPEAVKRLRAGRSVVFYPEGHRSPASGLRRFHRGAAHVALEAGCDLVPVLIHVTPRTLMKGQSWADSPEPVPVWRIEVGKPIRPADAVDASESRARAARRITAVLEDHYGKRWNRGTP